MGIVHIKLDNGEVHQIRYKTLRMARFAAMMLNRPDNAIVYAYADRR